MTKLRRLELSIESGGNRTLLEAIQWKEFFADRLTEWHLRFRLLESEGEHIDERSIVSQFVSSFGRVIPCLTFDREQLTFFTIPRFLPRPVHWPQPNGFPLDHVEELQINQSIRSAFRLLHVKRLTLLTKEFDQNLLAGSQVQSLTIRWKHLSIKHLIRVIERSFTHLSQLTIDCQCSAISMVHLQPLKQIRVLHLSHPSALLIDFSQIFPCVERLVAQVKTMDEISQLIEQFKYLTSASFHFSERFNDQLPVSQWVIDHSTCSSLDPNFTVRYKSQPTVSLHLWISNPRHHSRERSSTDQQRSARSKHCALS